MFILLICFLNVSCVFALENETSNLTSSIFDEPILTEEINNQPEPNLSNNPQIDTYLNTSDVFKYYSGPESFNAYLLDSNNNPLVNKTVHITINGITYNKITDSNGHVSLSINLNSGDYTVFTFFEGDEYYKPCNMTNNVHVNSTIYANDVVMYYCNGTQYISLFFSNNGSPATFSLCNDFNCLYVTGESDHGMGMTVIGNESDVWKFHFTCSFAFSLIEQLVGSNIWNDSTIGSVTLGLLESYLNNESLELIYENGYCFLKVLGG